MNIHHYSPETGEYLTTSPARPNPMEPGEFLIPAHTTAIEPPAAIEGMARVFTGAEWTLVEDHRGTPIFGKADGQQTSMVAPGPIPDDYTLAAPPVGLMRPRFENGSWIETAIVFQGREVASKADVDRITRQRIIDLGEEKAKTEKILAGSGPCQFWDDFIAQRVVILQEGDDFIVAHDLT